MIGSRFSGRLVAQEKRHVPDTFHFKGSIFGADPKRIQADLDLIWESADPFP
jgi:hypothetical protein